jgi:cytoskeletal protein RodZ
MFEIGTSLREARARRKLSYDQVEAETKVRAKYIRALEDEEFDVLPSGTYVKGFLRTYADYLGLDGQLYVDEYNSRHGDLHPEDQLFRRRERPAPQRRPQSSNAVLVGLAGIVAVAVLFFVAWKWGATTPGALPIPPAATETVQGNPQLDTQPLTPRKHRQRHAVKVAAVHRPKPPVTVKLLLRAVGGDSWLELRQGGAGPVIYGAVLRDGCTAGPVAFKSGFTIQNVPNPGYVHVVVNGKS